MKKILALSLLIVLFTGCSQKQEDVKIKDVESMAENIDLTGGFGLHNIENGYVYDGEAVNVDFDYEIDGRDCKLGVMIFIDGIPQKIDGDNKVYSFAANKGEKGTKRVSFTPNVGNKGDRLIMQGAIIYDNEIVNDLKSMENKQHFGFCGSTTLTYHQDSTKENIADSYDVSYFDISKEKLMEFQDKGDDYLVNNLLPRFLNTNGTYQKDAVVSLEIIGRPNLYRVWLFEDLKPVQSYYVDLKTGKMATIDLKTTNQSSKNLKVVVLPLNGDLPEQSGSLVVE